MPLFEGSHDFVINGGHFTDTTGSNGIQYLAHHIASQATHDSMASRERDTCHPGTRIRVIGQIMEWVNIKDDARSIFWLHGPAGAGKSAIAQTVAEKLSSLGILGASFFFSRTDSTRNNVSRLLLTIAYQLAISWHSPALKTEVEKTIEDDPNIVNRRMELQWEKLIMRPIKAVLCNRELENRLIIIIDGLDECLNEQEQLDMLEIFNLCGDQPFRIVMFSRPEPHLFEAISEVSSITIHGLQRTTEVDDEIRLYLRDNFQRVRNLKRFRLSTRRVGDQWPSDVVVNKLVSKASGQFIYASTVVKYLQSRKESPITLLEYILNIRAGHGQFAALDMLYQRILEKTAEEGDHMDRMLTIIGFMLVILKEERRILFPTLSVIEQLLALKPGEMELALYGLQSLIHIPDLSLLSTWDVHEPFFFHASLEDFLTDRNRSGIFFIDLNDISERITACCTRILAIPLSIMEDHVHASEDLYSNSCNFFGWYYSLSNWLNAREERGANVFRSLSGKFLHVEMNAIRSLRCIFDLVSSFRENTQYRPTDSTSAQLACDPSLEAFIIISSILISKLNKSSHAEYNLASLVDISEQQAFSDFLDFLTCNPYINTQFRAILFGYLSEFLHSKTVPSIYILPHPIAWCETAFAQGIFAKLFWGQYESHAVCVRKDIRYYTEEDEMVYKKLPHPILTSRHFIHPNLIPFYGVEIHPPLEDDDWYTHQVLDWALCAITPYMDGGNINEYLWNTDPIDTNVYFLLISDIISALSYINENGMIIQSWTTEGILISPNGRAYLTGFQSSIYSFYDDMVWNLTDRKTDQQLKTLVRYSSPEMLGSGSCVLTVKSNVYSLATICFEILTKIVAFVEQNGDINSVMNRITSGGHPTRPNETEKCWNWNGGPMSEDHWKLFLECWNLDPKKRPAITEIYDRLCLKDIVDARPKDDWDLSNRFNDLKYGAHFVTPGAIGTTLSLLKLN